MSILDLPILDLSNDNISTLGAQFHKAGETTGFMQIVNHGVSPDLMDTAFSYAEKFFELPLEEKVKVARDPNTSRGYLLFGSQALEGSLGSGHEGAHILDSAKKAMKSADHKEGFTMARDTPRGHANWGRRAHGENRLPPEQVLPGLDAFQKQYTDAMWTLQAKMSDIVASSLGTDPAKGFTADAMRDAIILWRFLHYPAAAEPDVTGIGAHTDFGFTTLLATNGEPGLQVYYKGAWHSVEPERGAFIVNIGDCLARMSGGKYKSSLHRVINNTGSTARYSIPCFLEGNPDFVVRPLDASLEGDYPTVMDLLEARHRETFK